MNNSLRKVRTSDGVALDAWIYMIYCAIIPLNMILNFTGATINRYVGIAAAVILGAACIVRKRRMLPVTALNVVWFLAWAFLSMIWTVSDGRTKSQLMTITSCAALYFVCVVRGFHKIELKRLKQVMILAAALLVFFLAPNLAVSYSRSTLTSSAGSADHNRLAANICFALWMAIDMIQAEPGFRRKLPYLSAIISMVIALFFIASRGAILAMVISLFVYFVICKRIRIKSRQWLLLILGVIGIGLCLSETNPIALSRLSLASIRHDGGTGRFSIWYAIVTLLRDHPWRILFGYGFGCEGEVGQLALFRYVGTHNVYLEMLATVGLIGLLLFGWMLLCILRSAWRRQDYLAVALLTVLAVVFLFLGFSKDKGAWNVLMLATTGCGNDRLQPTQTREDHRHPKDILEPQGYRKEVYDADLVSHPGPLLWSNS